MSWEIQVGDEFKRGVLEDCAISLADYVEEKIDQAKADGEEYDINSLCWDDVFDAVDGKFIYNVDRLAAILYFGKIDAAFDACYEELEEAVVELAEEIIEDRLGE